MKKINENFLKKGRAGCYTKLPTVQDMLQPIPGLISLAIYAKVMEMEMPHACRKWSYSCDG